jgi:hypothetical protein
MQQTWRATAKYKNNDNSKNKKVTLLIKNYLEPVYKCDWRARKDRSSGRGLKHTDINECLENKSNWYFCEFSSEMDLLKFQTSLVSL